MAYYPSASTCSRWTRPRSGGKTPALQRDLMRTADEKLPAQNVHLVEFADLRDAILDLDVWRDRRRGRVRQPVLSDPRRQDRQGARLRARVGDLYRLHGALHGAPIRARLAPSHRRHATDAGKLQTASVAEAASAEFDRNAGWKPPHRIATRRRDAAH